ncbi:MAG: c-type cytochrome biogenesis protein CcmI [Defluviicoccus sp.]|nr:c-type cytochrome biogenesis protein CcmI [Defluviicoccus sp.]MDE0384675.1 c-type cytochrome biogenesis protein CcmI [Defluviicoccus sp.]
MILLAVLAGLALAAMLCVLMPLLRPQVPPRARAEHDVEIYRDQLAEIERDRDRGLVSEDQLDAARAEIGRRLLAADAARREPAARRDAPQMRAILAASLAAVLPLAAGGLYVWQGAPLLSGGSANDSTAASGTRPAEHEADMATLVARLAERMQDRPDDARGWRLLGRSLASLGRYDEAARAYGRATALLPADAELRSRRAEALTAASGGTVTPEAEQGFAAALRIDPGEPRAGFYLGLAALQKGDRDGALARWRALEAASPEDAEWLPMLRRRIASLAPGPTREDVEAAERLVPEERAAMIRGMVQGLAMRLQEEPDDVEGWARLARSWRVLGEAENERDALRQAAAAADRTGDRGAALRHWSRLRELLPEDSPERAEIAKRIDALGGGT